VTSSSCQIGSKRLNRPLDTVHATSRQMWLAESVSPDRPHLYIRPHSELHLLNLPFQTASYLFVNRCFQKREVQINLNYNNNNDNDNKNYQSVGLGERTWFSSSRSLKDNCEFLSLKMMDSGVENVSRTDSFRLRGRVPKNIS